MCGSGSLSGLVPSLLYEDEDEETQQGRVAVFCAGVFQRINADIRGYRSKDAPAT